MKSLMFNAVALCGVPGLIGFIGLVGLIGTSLPTQAQAADTRSPRDIAVAFFDLAFVQRKPVEAAQKYISPERYVQHSPGAGDGREEFIEGVAHYVSMSKYRCDIKRVIAENDLVAIHSHCRNDPDDPTDRGSALVDIFRVADGWLVEHWDVDQPVPAKSHNDNTMF